MTPEDEYPQVRKCPTCYWRRAETAPESKKRLTQSRNDAQMWMCLVVKVKSNAVKSNIA